MRRRHWTMVRARPAWSWNKSCRTTIVAIVMIAGGIATLCMPLMLSVAMMPLPRAHRYEDGRTENSMLDRARAYNKRLLASPSVSVGEAMDPFWFGSGSGVPAYETDSDYQSQLGSGSHMAVIRIPRIGVNMSIGHGTAESTLFAGAGHVYGTSLPTGDEGNAVIAAHRGLGARLLFYRLGELGEGDMVYTAAAGHTVAWQVDRVSRVEPGGDEERRAIEAREGKTVLTLYTCDPPGLNTMRLLVIAHRVPYVDPADVPGQSDPWRLWISVGIIGVPAVVVVMLSKPRPPVIRHGTRKTITRGSRCGRRRGGHIRGKCYMGRHADG